MYNFVDPALNFVPNVQGGRCNGLINLGNIKDPLEFVQHDAPDFEVAFYRQQGTVADNYPLGVGLSYPGTNNSTLMVRARMPNAGNGANYNNSVMNIDRVDIEISEADENNFDHIQGLKFESKLYLGARIGTDRYPIRNTPQSNSSNQCCMDYTDIACTDQDGDWGVTGMRAYAYTNRPWDEFYYADFKTRIHQNHMMGTTGTFAHCPTSARYPDGQYQARATVTDIRGGTHDSDPEGFNIDNFQPYIKEINKKNHIFYKKI